MAQIAERISDNNEKLLPGRMTVWITTALFLMVGAALFVIASSGWQADEYQSVWDLQWLNGWLLCLPVMFFVLWRAKLTSAVRTWLMLLCLSVWAFVAVSLVFHGTPFSWNAFWGDQKFRQAMILKFMTFWVPTDYYYNDLPPFYPPLYYYLLSLWGRVFSIEYFKLLKIGGQLIYLFGPALLFLLWRNLLSNYRALMVTAGTFILGGLYYHIPLSVPHEFVANAVFIPWWLCYVDGAGDRPEGWRRYLVGGAIGGATLMTYYYAFFIGGLLIAARALHWVWCRWQKRSSDFRPAKSYGMLGAAALFSAPYWVPLVYSMLVFGNHPSQREWFHISYANLRLLFIEFSLPGLLALGALYYLYRYRSYRICRGMLGLVGAVVGLYGLGLLAGNLGQPILYVKAAEFLLVLAGAMIGLVLAGLLRYERLVRPTRGALGMTVLVLVVLLGHDFTSLAKVREVETARSSYVYTFGTDRAEMAEREGAVILTTHETFASFYPVYLFNAHNQHYAHNASRYLERHHFLYLLQWVEDPGLFHLALRQNRYDAVDYFMPEGREGRFRLWSNLSRYPDRFVVRDLLYSRRVASDTNLFRRVGGDSLYQVVDIKPSLAPGGYTHAYRSEEDSLVAAYRMLLLSEHLDQDGRRQLLLYAGVDTSGWRRLDMQGSGTRLDKYGEAYLIPQEDSQLLMVSFQVDRPVKTDYKIFLHAYRTGGEFMFENYDFLPGQKTTSWQLRDVRICSRKMPADSEVTRLHIGFFIGGSRLGEGWWADLSGS